VVVGSGPSAVHFAWSALDRGWNVTMLDVGRAAPPPVRPDDSFDELKRTLEDPAEYFLGRGFEGVLFPGHAGEYYGFPPHKGYIFEGVERFAARAGGFAPLVSFARGGLAEAWTGGSFPFNDAELARFGLSYGDLAPYYGEIARRVGISGAGDDLARFLPVHAHLSAPLDLDEHSRRFLETYERRREALHRLGCFVGRSRSAVTRDGVGERRGCTYLGRCLWGCPTGALYTPSLTLGELRRRDGFEYSPGVFVERFEADAANRVRAVEAIDLATGASRRFESERLVLAAGTLASSKIFLDSLARIGGGAPELPGLMDNRQVLMPFVNLAMIGKRAEPKSYQYHLLALGLAQPEPEHYVHGLITTLKTALIHPIVQSVPLDLRSALYVFGNAHAALGLLNVNFHDTRRADCAVALEPDGAATRLVVRYSPPADEPERMRRTLATLRRALRALGCFVPPGMTHVRPMGASVHYAGTLPMSRARAPLTVSPSCESHDFAGVFLADASTFPFLPAKNLTFTLMANASRIADAAF
jgi:choline dehydrogenase-like flavoprotein